MNVLFLLTYYHPHLSGLTIAARNRAEGLAARGHRVTVICSQQRADWLREEMLGGVRVCRLPVRLRAGKGVWMPGYGRCVAEHAAESDAIVQCLPVSPMEAFGAVRAVRQTGKPLVLDYACDLQLPGGWMNRLMEAALRQGHLTAGRAAQAVVVSTASYAETSPFLSRFGAKVRVVPLTIRIPAVAREAADTLRAAHAAPGQALIGFAGRMAAEKGIEVLLQAVGLLRAHGRAVRLLLAGDVEGVVGEQAYRQQVLRQVGELGDACRVLGVIQPDLSAFYAACDVLVLPSRNRTESFGMVQAEAMLCGTPVVASRLPGVREAVERTGMGMLAEPGDARGLAAAIGCVLDEPSRYRADPEAVQREFSAERSLQAFEDLLRECAR